MLACVFFLFVLAACRSDPPHRNWYFDPGADPARADGSLARPYAGFDALKTIALRPGDSVLLRGGAHFPGTFSLTAGLSGKPGLPIAIASYGGGRALLDAGNGTAVNLTQCAWLSISGLVCRGAGRKEGNASDGFVVDHGASIRIDSVDVSGFRNTGLLIVDSRDVQATDCYATANGNDGFRVTGRSGRTACRDITLTRCVAENNPGNPANLTNHSGNGILAAYCTRVRFDRCTAMNNGWDMPRQGNGPVGIWCFEADSVTIEHCLSYRNKTSKGGEDGGGFDLDGGVTNSVIQYCFSYGNQGAGYGLFQYAGASPWRHNVVRYCISENDGAVSSAGAGIAVWNAAGDPDQFTGCDCYGNTVYNSLAHAVNYAGQSAHRNFRFINNVLVGRDSVIGGAWDPDEFIFNFVWSLQGKRNLLAGTNLNPRLPRPGRASVTRATQLDTLTAYAVAPNSVLRMSGMTLPRVLGLRNSLFDFNGLPAPPRGVGAAFLPANGFFTAGAKESLH